MMSPADASVVVCTNISGIARTVRMALRGMGVRNVVLASDVTQLLDGFAVAEPHCVILYVDSEDPADDGLTTLNFIRKSDDSPHPRIPVVAVSPRRDLQTINAVMNGGAHEYVLFPASGEVLLKKITAARTTTRPWIERADYFGPERRVDREASAAAAEACEKTAG
ncbi:MAG: response regulator [Hyphomonadaceae bacterium]|nr:response regulator [Hyphomonadaceae bacterium]